MRDRIYYSVGSEHNPGDPFGRSWLVIEVDGQARLDQFTRAGHSAWTGTVAASALDKLWAALEEAKFPAMPRHPVPAGSAIRDLNVGGPDGKSAYIAYHAAESLPGYNVAFYVLDSVIRQISEDTVKCVPASDSRIVEAIARVPAQELDTTTPQRRPAISPGTAFLLAYLPARRVAHLARLELLDLYATLADPALDHAIEFSRRALKIEESKAADADKRLADIASKAALELPPMPPARDVPAWLAALPGHVRPSLTTPVLEAAWKAGERARLVSISVALAAHIAYLRCAAPENPDLRAEAEDRARDLEASSSALTADLTATGLPLVISQAGNVAEMVRLTNHLMHTSTPSTTGGYRQLNELVRDLDTFLEGKVRQLDTAPPTAAATPTADEDALLARIIATPHDLRLRLEFAALAERRNDPRAQLIKLQLTGIEDDDHQKAMDLIDSHPEWTARLEELGARDIKFGAGFPNTITVDAAVLLARGAELFAAAPLRGLRVRAAKGRVGEIVRLPLLAMIDSLDLDDQGVTDDEMIALAASPHAARLRQLDLRYNPLTARGIEALAASPHLKRLEVVNLDGNPADPVDRLEYYDETNQHAVPTEAGKALEAKYGPLRWLRRS
jgi:uncharacterized protein (TIGR02996 family)